MDFFVHTSPCQLILKRGHFKSEKNHRELRSNSRRVFYVSMKLIVLLIGWDGMGSMGCTAGIGLNSKHICVCIFVYIFIFPAISFTPRGRGVTQLRLVWQMGQSLGDCLTPSLTPHTWCNRGLSISYRQQSKSHQQTWFVSGLKTVDLSSVLVSSKDLRTKGQQGC